MSFSPWWPQEISFRQRLQWNAYGLPFAGATQGHFIFQVGWYLDLYERFFAFSPLVWLSVVTDVLAHFGEGASSISLSLSMTGVWNNLKGLRLTGEELNSTDEDVSNACSGLLQYYGLLQLLPPAPCAAHAFAYRAHRISHRISAGSRIHGCCARTFRSLSRLGRLDKFQNSWLSNENAKH